jgi:DNA polymerase (family X)
VKGLGPALQRNWRWHGGALELGCMMSINPDAHSISELDLTHWGVEMARKGGVPRARVLNCLGLREIAEFFEQRKSGTIPVNARARRPARAPAGSRRSSSSPIKSVPKPFGRTPRS